MNRKNVIIFIAMLCCFANVSAQEADSLRNAFAQVSIWYPIGTHGEQSVEHQYNLSLNIFAGEVGGVNGLEVSGLVGVMENLRGIQIAGLGNGAGVINGVQLAGLLNGTGNMNGIQVVGFANFTDGLNGIQIAGFANTTSLDADANGVQISTIYLSMRATNTRT